MNPGIWSKHERFLVDAVTNRVSVLAMGDGRRIWNSLGAEQSFRHGLIRLMAAQLLEVYAVCIRRSDWSTTPICFVGIEQRSQINHREVSAKLKGRWSHSRKLTHVLTASRNAANLFGSTSFGLPPLGHREHDVLLGTVYANYVLRAPEDSRAWVGEHALPKAGYRMKDPDAFLMKQRKPYRIVESGGSYGTRQVESLVNFAADRKLPLEIW